MSALYNAEPATTERELNMFLSVGDSANKNKTMLQNVNITHNSMSMVTVMMDIKLAFKCGLTSVFKCQLVKSN